LFKLNQNRRRHIPRQRRRVTNWPAYDASLRQRGSLTVWFTDEAVTSAPIFWLSRICRAVVASSCGMQDAGAEEVECKPAQAWDPEEP